MPNDPNDKYEEQIAIRDKAYPRLEPSGDPEHDRLTDEVHGLDALHPHRSSVVKEDYDQVVEDSDGSD